MTPAELWGHPIPLCCTDHRSRHPCGCKSCPGRYSGAWCRPGQLSRRLGAGFLQHTTKAARLSLSPASHLHQCLFYYADSPLCRKRDGVASSEEPTQQLWAVPGSAPCTYQHKDSFCSSITGLRSPESQFTDTSVCVPSYNDPSEVSLTAHLSCRMNKPDSIAGLSCWARHLPPGKALQEPSSIS